MYKKIGFIFLFILLISFVHAEKVITNIDITEGYDIEATIKDYIRTEQDYIFNIHVFNKSNGVPITSGISCYAHLYDLNGVHLYTGSDSVVSNDFDYSFNITSGNFTRRGEYQIKFQCNSSTLGGGSETYFNVNDYGEELFESVASSFNWSMGYLMVLFIFSIIGIFYFNSPAGKLACYWVTHVLFVVGTFSVWQFNSGYAMGYVGLAGIWGVLFYVSIIAMFPALILSLAWIFYIHVMNDDIKNLMNRGMNEDDAYKKARRKKRW